MIRPAIALVTLALAALALAACQGGPQHGDAVLLGGDPGELCAPADVSDVFVVGEVATLAGNETAKTLIGAELVDAQGIEVVQTFAVPMSGEDPIMSMTLDAPVGAWSDRTELEGVVLNSEPVNVALKIRRTADVSTARAVRLLYRDGDGVRFSDGTTAIVLADSCF